MEEFKTYRRLVEKQYQRIANQVLEAQDFAGYQRMVGGLKAIEEAFSLPEVVLNKMEELRDRTKSDAESATRAADEQRAGRYGSRYWKSPGMAGTTQRP